MDKYWVVNCSEKLCLLNPKKNLLMETYKKIIHDVSLKLESKSYKTGKKRNNIKNNQMGIKTSTRKIMNQKYNLSQHVCNIASR